MIETILERKQAGTRARLTVKMLTVLSVVILAVALPQLTHTVAGASGGIRFLPMYLPVLLGGCLLGTRWGLAAGLLAPVMSYLYTSALGGSPMPAAARLPFMMAELAIMAAVTGAFAGRIAKNPLWAFAAVPAAFAAGRGAFFLAVLALQSLTSLKPAMIAAQLRTGLVGVAIQIVLVPLLVLGIAKLTKQEGGND
ncbi:MAG TPA: ECF transporter S component [Clostridiales bacterium]|nr:ECF transporter S component [Clostridiales bacterium]